MRPILVAAGAVAAALALGCGSFSSATAPTSVEGTQTSSPGTTSGSVSSATGSGFSSVAPAGGSVVETSYLTMHLTGRWAAATPGEADTLKLLDGAAPGANIQVKSTTGVTTDQLGTVANAIEQQIVKGHPDAMFTEADGDVAGAPAKAIMYTAMSSGVAVKGMEIFTVHGAGDYFFVLSASVADFPIELAQFQAMLTSVSWR